MRSMNTGPPGPFGTLVGLIALAVSQTLEMIDSAFGIGNAPLAGMGGMTLANCGATIPQTAIENNRFGGLHDTRVRTDDFRARSVPLSVTRDGSAETHARHLKTMGGSSFRDNASSELGY